MVYLHEIPDLLTEIHPSLNKDINVNKLTTGSKQKIWWLGKDCGHEWESSVGNRAGRDKTGCPYCSGQKVLAGFNDLTTTHPALAEEWHPSKNSGLVPSEFRYGSKQKVWWLGTCGHEWETGILLRASRNAGCPYCSGQKVLAGFNDLATAYPELAEEWHPTKNGDMSPSQVSAGSRMKTFWWLGDCGHEWESNVLNRVAGNGCYQCLGRKKASTQGFLKDDSVLMGEYHPTLNGHVILSSLKKFSLVKVWWLGKCGHEWEATVSSRSTGHGCHYCSGNNVKIGFNDLGTTHPELAKEWHLSKNGSLKAEDVIAGSNQKVWWLGACGHEWKSSIGGRSGSRKHGCVYCSGREILVGFNDLASQSPDLVKQWHLTKNMVNPSQIHNGSIGKYWWVCDKGHEWEAELGNRVRVKSGCPTCAASTYVSKAERSIADFITGLGFDVNSSVRNLIKGELDIFVPEKNVAIEFNGLYWHSEAGGKDKNYHRNKWQQCKDKDIQLIQVWEDDWNRNPELVKRMLAHKLGVSAGGKVYARKTQVKTLSSKNVEEFLAKNHLQGYRAAKYFGLIFEENIVAVLGVQKKGENGLEIIRFATSMSVPGGFTKLLTHVLKQPEYAHVEQVISYSHNDHSSGGVYEANGFVLEHTGSPGYGYWKSGWPVRQNRLKYSPSRIRNNSELVFIEGATERELATLNGITRVWDSGSSLWVKHV